MVLPVMSTCERLKQEDCDFLANLGCTERYQTETKNYKAI